MPSLGRPAHATFLLRLKGEEGGARLPPAERPAHRVRNLGTLRGDLMASKSLTFFDKKNLNWGGLKKWQKLSSVICSFTQQGHFVMSSCPQMKPENVISSPPRVEKRVFQLLRF